jgi:F0F1-type ATP synthase membrane subunit c/vacuolar-type H+-ATPase subunit K
MFTLQNAATDPTSGQIVLTTQNGYGIFAIGVLVGLALLLSAYYQGRCLSSAINASKSKPEVFGISIAPAGIVEGFAVFAFVFALVLSGSMAAPEMEAPTPPTPITSSTR